MLELLLALSLLASSGERTLVIPLPAGEGINEKTAQALTDSVAAELRRSGLTVVTREEITAVLSLERQRQLFGCGTESCVTELGAALNVRRLVSGSVARLGNSWLLHLKLVDGRNAETLAQADRRIQAPGMDAVLDALPGLTAQLASGQPGEAAAAVPSVAQKSALPSGVQDEPFSPAPDLKRFQLVTDGKGKYLAFVPFGGTSEPLFAGDGKSFWAQRVFGGGSEGKIRFNLAFWEPRFAETSTFDFKDGKYALWCGRTERPFSLVPSAKAQALLEKAKFYKARWRRKAHALARDDEGNYLFVDAPRESEGPLHVYRGERGAMKGEVARALSQDSAGEVLGVEGGKLKLDFAKRQAEWISSGTRTPLTWLVVEDNAPLIYSQLGVYAGAGLGTPCD